MNIKEKAFTAWWIILIIAVCIAFGFWLGEKGDINANYEIRNTPIFSDFKVFCPVCQEKRLKSSVYEGSSSTTLLYNPIWYDEDGNLQYVNTNTTTTYFSCSKGHEWYEKHCMGDTIQEIIKDTEDEPETYTLIETEDNSRTEFDENISLEHEDDTILTCRITGMTFGDNVGRIYWDNGAIEFEGNVAESAKIFFDFLSKLFIDEYIQSELEKEEPIELTTEEPEQIMYMYVTSGEWAKDFRPQWFLKVVSTDMSRCLIDGRLRLDLNGEIYWIRLEED